MYINSNSSIGIVFVPKTGSQYLSLEPVPVNQLENIIGKDMLKKTRGLGLSHMPISIVKKIIYPNTPIFTVIRDPYERSCSEYFFIKRKTKSIFKTFETWDLNDSKKIEFVSEHAAKTMQISGWGAIKDEIPKYGFYEKTYNICKYNMDIEEYLEWSIDNPTYPLYYDILTPKEFDCVGITEEMQKTIYLLKKMYNIEISPGNHNNNSNKKINEPYINKYPKTKFKKNNKIEYDMYYEGKEKFLKLCKSI